MASVNILTNIDPLIVSSFLIINLLVGIFYGRGITTLKCFAIGDRNFSTATITGTIIATWIGAGFFASSVSETYYNGLWHIIARVGDFLTLAIVGMVIAPRIGEFFGKITVAEIMNDLYGKKIRIITAICSIALAIGYVAVQIKVLSTLFSYFFGIPQIYSVLISSSVIIIYSSFGGILSVTFTDMIQVFTFGVFVPLFAFFLWMVFGSSEAAIANIFATNPIFNYANVFNYKDSNFWISLMLFIYFTLPALDPVTFQRILMAKNVIQVRKSFVYASICCLLIGVMACLIGIIALSHNPNMDPDNLIIYVVDHYSFPGLKGITLIAIMSMGMSTADSYVNASAVIFSNDFCKPLGIQFIKNELLLSRSCSCFIGIIAILFVLFTDNLFGLLLLAGNFYTPIITAPLMMAIFGFRTTSRSVLIGMISGFIVTVLWRIYIQSITNIDSIIPGTIANLLALLLSHYLLREAGGWTGIKDTQPLIALRAERKRKLSKLIHLIKSFNLIKFLKGNLPQEQTTFSVVGVFVIISIYSSMYTITSDIRDQYQEIYNLIYHSVLILSMGFLTCPIWPIRCKNEKFLSMFWILGVFYMLICASATLVIISGFGQMQLMIFILNLVVIGILFKWETTLLMTIFGVLLSMYCFKWYGNQADLVSIFSNIQLKIIYSLLLFSGVLIAFLKPKQQRAEVTEVLRGYFEEQTRNTQLDLIRLFRHREEFVNRLDKQCISIFRSSYDQIVALGKRLENKVKDNKEIELIKIINRIKIGSEYLDDLIKTVKNRVKIKSSQVNIEQFIYDVIDEYKKISGKHDLQIIIELKIRNKEIEFDQNYIKKIILIYIDHGMMNSNASNINILVENTKIEYNPGSKDQLTIKRKAIKLLMIFNDAHIKQTDINKLLNPTFNSINEINFAEVYRVISAHYGKMNITLSKSNHLMYSLIMPAKLKEIRPKKNDLPDYEVDQINHSIINNKEILRDIAKQLIATGMDVVSIAKITKLTLKELKELKI